MTPTGDTWGISGPVFLLVYLVLGVAVTLVVVRRRRALADAPTTPGVGGLDAYPYDVAVLNGGGELAVCAALAALRGSGTIATAGRGTVVATGRLDTRADELERAVHHAASAPVPRRQLLRAAAVAAVLDRIESRLRAAGLLLDPDRRRRIRATAGWTLALAALGVVRIVAGLGNGRPVGFLAVLVLLTVTVGLAQLRSVPRRSRAGDAVLRRLADQHHALAPALRPDWTAYGPRGAALAVGVFGVASLWASDPAFAGELALQRAAAAGAGGGDSGSSCSSGSSCGGGGGCGGGCGG